MKIITDEKNKATIAIGYHNGRKIKSVCVCSDDDQFDASFGTELAKKKWKAKKTFARIKDIDHDIRIIKNFMRDLKNRKTLLLVRHEMQENDISGFYENYFGKFEKKT